MSTPEVVNTTAPVTVATLTSSITTKLSASFVHLKDTSGGCGQMFEAIIVSPVFKGKTTLMRHRAANAALKEEIAGVHAWSQKCFTEEEWERRRGEFVLD
ncbi:bola domain-containing protein [Tuber indicum]|nr:bola domain-containing protein [Tuber indicum]